MAHRIYAGKNTYAHKITVIVFLKRFQAHVTSITLLNLPKECVREHRNYVSNSECMTDENSLNNGLLPEFILLYLKST